MGRMIQNRNNTVTPVSEETLKARKQVIYSMIPQFQKALPTFFSPDRFARICCNILVPKNYKDQIQINKLLSCNPNTFFGALLACAQLGLEPDGLLGQAYLVPYGNRVQLLIGYRGLIDLARRSGEMTSLVAHSVHQNDEFSFDFGTCELPHHTFNLTKDRGEVIAFYAIARFKDGSYHFDLMTKPEVDAIRRRSAHSGDDTPWGTDYEEMGKKTVIRRIAKYLPMSVQKACAYDGHSADVNGNSDVVITTEAILSQTEDESLPQITESKSEVIVDSELQEEKLQQEKQKVTDKPKPVSTEKEESPRRDFDYYQKVIQEAQTRSQLASIKKQFAKDCKEAGFDDGDYITIENMIIVKEEAFGE